MDDYMYMSSYSAEYVPERERSKKQRAQNYYEYTELIPVEFKGLGKEGDFTYMIKEPRYKDALFIFNENEEAFLSEFKKGTKGNAAIRPYRYTDPVRAIGIPTGHRYRFYGEGYKSLTNRNKMIIDTAIIELRELLSTRRYNKVFYSADHYGNLGTSIFEVGDEVKDYILKELSKAVQ